MKEFKVGMRGKVYGYSSEGRALYGLPVVIEMLRTVVILEVRCEKEKRIHMVHRRQFIPFKQKKPLREFWVIYYNNHVIERLYTSLEEIPEDSDGAEIVHFIERREKKK